MAMLHPFWSLDFRRDNPSAILDFRRDDPSGRLYILDWEFIYPEKIIANIAES
ncbi:hypothetical protein [Calothrix sp. NIES-3974]|uniref:hypothetical protein n=1 Tax=Calothrix sp. NIES-3974 TaxID=2005462 RepID=UPI0012FE1463|nr:hypothetical protein [Calothrix sp. NIES-3974]